MSAKTKPALTMRRASEIIAAGEAYEKRLNALCYRDGDVIYLNNGRYPVELNRCDTHEKLVDWVAHLCSKGWMTRDLILKFMEVAGKANGLKIHGNA